MEREKGFEPSTSTLARLHSTTELFPRLPGAASMYATRGGLVKRGGADVPGQASRSKVPGFHVSRASRWASNQASACRAPW